MMMLSMLLFKGSPQLVESFVCGHQSRLKNNFFCIPGKLIWSQKSLCRSWRRRKTTSTSSTSTTRRIDLRRLFEQIRFSHLREPIDQIDRCENVWPSKASLKQRFDRDYRQKIVIYVHSFAVRQCGSAAVRQCYNFDRDHDADMNWINPTLFQGFKSNYKMFEKYLLTRSRNQHHTPSVTTFIGPLTWKWRPSYYLNQKILGSKLKYVCS